MGVKGDTGSLDYGSYVHDIQIYFVGCANGLWT